MRNTLLKALVGCVALVTGVAIGSVKQHFTRKTEAPAQVVKPLPPPPPESVVGIDSYPEDLGVRVFDIENFVNEHPNANLDRLWERLGVTDDDDPSTPFGGECWGCRATSFQYNLDYDPYTEIVLQIKNDHRQSYRYLIFKEPYYNLSNLLGHVDVWAKYPPSDPVVLLSGGRAWLVLQSTGATGSGLGAWVDTIYQVRNGGIRSVTSYLSRVQQSGDPTFPSKVFVGRPISCEISDGHAIVKVAYTVQYSGDLGPEEIDLFTKQQDATFIGVLRDGSESFDRSRSTMTQHELHTIYNFDSMGEDDFLAYNRAELRAIAVGKDSRKKKWLKEFLQTCSSSAIKRELLTLLH